MLVHLRGLFLQNITFFQSLAVFCDGDAMVVRNTNMVTLDANRFDE